VKRLKSPVMANVRLNGNLAVEVPAVKQNMLQVSSKLRRAALTRRPRSEGWRPLQQISFPAYRIDRRSSNR